MNDLVIIQTTQGLAQYLLSETNPTIPVSFDLPQNVERTDSINYVIGFAVIEKNYATVDFITF